MNAKAIARQLSARGQPALARSLMEAGKMTNKQIFDLAKSIDLDLAKLKRTGKLPPEVAKLVKIIDDDFGDLVKALSEIAYPQ